MTGDELVRAIANASIPAEPAKSWRIVPGQALTDLAARSGRGPRELEILALENGAAPARYQRNFNCYTLAEQARLLAAKTAMLGLGGLGGNVLEILLRAGVGRFALADGDVFEESNLNRQILATPATLGLAKAAAAKERAALVNPAAEVTALHAAINEETVSGFLRGADVAVDALGGLAMRRELAGAAARAGIPLVSAAVAGQTGWVSVARPGEPCPAQLLGAGTSVESETGTPAPAVTLAASVMAGSVLDLLCGRNPPLGGKMLLFDLADCSFETVSLI